MPVIAFKNEKKQKGACRLPGGGGGGGGVGWESQLKFVIIWKEVLSGSTLSTPSFIHQPFYQLPHRRVG